MAVVRSSAGVVRRVPERTVASWPHALRAELAVFMVCTAITLLLAHLWDAPLKEPANPLVPENPAKAPWYFLGLQELVSYSAFMGGVVIPSIAILGLALIPYLDRRPGKTGRWLESGAGRGVLGWSLAMSGAVTLAMIAFTVRFGWLRNWFPNIPQIVIILFNPGTVLVAAFAALSLGVLQKTGSTRMAAIALFTAFLVGFTILTYFATVHRGPNWNFYWTRSSWPVH
jgi:quinol-cytochrome oxidoreductase complex cytochrome b subunit